MKPSDKSTNPAASPMPSSSAPSVPNPTRKPMTDAEFEAWGDKVAQAMAEGLNAKLSGPQDRNPPLSMRDPKTLTPEQKEALARATELSKAA